ncbi:hypothetical protein ACQE3E_07970 [Methylomonas sp. MED-D]|nr:hypothetical protein [Methylomonas koyamae]
MDLSLPSMALDARFPAGMTVLNKSDKAEFSRCRQATVREVEDFT